MSTVLQELDDAPGGSIDLDGRALIDALEAAHDDSYRSFADK